jgi:hypothetical protein
MVCQQQNILHTIYSDIGVAYLVQIVCICSNTLLFKYVFHMTWLLWCSYISMCGHDALFCASFLYELCGS